MSKSTSTANENPGNAPEFRDVYAKIMLPILAFALIVYLGLRGGGWGTVIHGEASVLVLVGVIGLAIAGRLIPADLDTVTKVAIGLLAAFTAWTALAVAWTASSERTLEELIRVALYLAVFLLALSIRGERALKRILVAVAGAIAVLGVLALLSRLHPAWFPPNDLAAAQPTTAARLNYPLNYWNGVAALLAFGIPLLLVLATALSRVWARLLCLVAIPPLALAIYFTYSRASLALVALALLIVVAVHRQRVRVIAIVALAAAASGLLIVLVNARSALADGLADDLAHSQGDQMIWITALVCLALAGAAYALARYTPDVRIGSRLPTVDRRKALIAAGTVAIVAIIGLAASGELGDRWETFKQPGAAGEGVERLGTTSGNGRYQYWSSATDAFAESPITGEGPGTFEYWWTRTATIPGPIRDAHSLYVESAAELGAPGVLLILGFVGAVAFAAIRYARAPGADRRLAAGALAAITVFVLAAGFDWLWEIPAVVIPFLLVAAAVLGQHAGGPGRGYRRGPLERLVPAGLAGLLLFVTVTSVAGTHFYQSSQEAAGAGDLTEALDDARTADSLRPYAATVSIQEAIVLAEDDDLEGALDASENATEQEPTNWETWSTRQQVEEALGMTDEAAASADRVTALNPESAQVP